MIRLLSEFKNKYTISNTYPGYGFGYLKKNIRGFNQASLVTPYFMLTDLDTYSCPLDLIKEWIKFPVHPNFIFRIAVREVESWLLADIDGLSAYFQVSKSNFPLQPDLENDPKNTLIQLAKRSRKRKIREDIVPVNTNASVGPNYNGCLMEFVLEKWKIHKAMKRSRSLQKAYARLDMFQIAK